MRAPPTALLVVLALLAGCGEDGPKPRPAPGPVPVARAPAPPGSIAGVGRRVDASLAGLRGEAAAGYARELLATALPADPTEARAAVLDALNTGSPTERWIALLAVPGLARLDDALFRALLPQTQAAEAYLHAAAYDALRNAQAIDDKAAERMWRVQAEAKPPLRAAILRGLGASRGSEGRDALLLAALAQDEPTEVRRAAAFALFRELSARPSLAERPPQLLAELQRAAGADDDHGARTYAVHALAQLGPEAAPAAGTLVERLQDASPRVRSGATTALVAIGAAAIEALRTALDARDDRLTEVAVYILRRIGTPEAVAELRACLRHDDPYVRGRTAMALRGMKVGDVDALGIYRTLLKHAEARIVLLGLEGLGMLGRDAAPALDDVRALGAHADPEVRNAARVWMEIVDRR